jgi:predicted 2-oxoglutarate/Fe(II)-dependent dioxygenase YbiX
VPDICEELAELLSTVQRPGDFYASRRVELLAPRLAVEGIGQIALPLLPVQAEQLIAIAERAHYGRGPATILDTNVRRTWQIRPDRVRLGGKHWQATLDRIVALAAEGLGVSDPISADLYKLLIYDKGSFFVSHRDTEKEPRMFATLVLALPSLASGGELVVRHKGREVKLDLASDEPSEMAFAAFYSDCVHEVLPVTSGYRATLIYNLIRKGKGGTPEPPSYERETAGVKALLQEWAKSKASPDAAPEKMIYPLEHAYSPAELVEVLDRWEHLTEWRRPGSDPVALGNIPIEDGEVSPPDALEEMEPDEEHFQEATGNEGASFERTYRRAALVLWPRGQRLAVINQAGPRATLPYLESLAARWIDEGAESNSALWIEAHELSGHMLDTWPTEHWYGGGDDQADDEGEEQDDTAADVERSGLARCLAALTKLRDETRIVSASSCSRRAEGTTRSRTTRFLERWHSFHRSVRPE